MWHRRDFFRSTARTGLALGLAAAGRPLIALPETGKTPAPGDDVVLLNTGRVAFAGTIDEVRDDKALITQHLGVF